VPAALWHFSEEASIRRFEPRAKEEHDSGEALVWAIDDAHAPAYWFPRECPRGTWWAGEETSDADVERFLLGDPSLRVHAVEAGWLDAMRSARVFGYRMPGERFEPYRAANGYWVASEPVEPLDVLPLGDLLLRHAEAGIELRVVPDLARVWALVAASTVAFSGIRLRNLP
jgi:hypothetical protein